MDNQGSAKALGILEKSRKKVWREIDSHLKDPKYPRHFAIPSEYESYNEFHWQLVKEYPTRQGKYLRPTLLMLTAQAMGAKSSDVIKTAAAMQISEDWILIHDDFQDKSILRRGKQSLHLQYSPEFAVNAGDALHVIMWKVLAENINILGLERSWDIYAEFYRMLMRTAMGQTSELRFMEQPVEKFSESDWIFVATSKTGYYTIAGPMRLGAIIAGASEKELEQLSEFGLYLGLCFQLVDDILDIKSDFGGRKEQGNDIYEGKRTLLLSHVVNNSSSANKKKIIKIINKTREEISKDEVDFVISQMNSVGTIEYATQKADQYKHKALDVLENKLKFLNKEPFMSDLRTLAHFVLERTY